MTDQVNSFANELNTPETGNVFNPNVFNPRFCKNYDDCIHAFREFCKKPIIEYVIVYVACDFYKELQRSILLVTKPEGSMHAGCLNFPGGKIQTNESPLDAALRELEEEVGVRGTFPKSLGAIIPSNKEYILGETQFIVHIIAAICPSEAYINRELPMKPRWYTIPEIINNDKADERKLVPNLRTIIPLCICNVLDFIVQDDYWLPANSGNDPQECEIITTFKPITRQHGDKPRFQT